MFHYSGKVCTSKLLNKVAVIEILNKAWSIYEHISDIGQNMFLFYFSNEAHAKKVMLKAP